MALTTGTHLGPYEIVSALGAGGMGEVYRARDTRLGRDVAIKILRDAVASDPDRRARFERETKAVAALSHPNILAMFDTGIHEGQLFAVTELLQGHTLRDRLTGGHGLSSPKTIELAVPIARGLAAAHAKGLVHRDLKPENIFLLEDGQVKILDFGLVRHVGVETASGATETFAGTDAGVVMGTVGYMAPEQVRGQTVDARADIFALGAVLYEMLSGRRAFQGETVADAMTSILTHDPPDLAGLVTDLPPALDRIVRHCLERVPASVSRACAMWRLRSNRSTDRPCRRRPRRWPSRGAGAAAGTQARIASNDVALMELTPLWSTDETRFFFSAQRGIFARDLRVGRVVPLLAQDGTVWLDDRSADGKFLVFEKGDPVTAGAPKCTSTASRIRK